jgi:hypothetical protein
MQLQRSEPLAIQMSVAVQQDGCVLEYNGKEIKSDMTIVKQEAGK